MKRLTYRDEEGTPHWCKELLDDDTGWACDLIRSTVADMEEAIGNCSIDRLRQLVEADKHGRLAILSEPMKPMVYKPNDTDVYCPKCGETLSGGWELSDADDGRKMVQCPKCGQAIDDTKCEPAAESALAKEE